VVCRELASVIATNARPSLRDHRGRHAVQLRASKRHRRKRQLEPLCCVVDAVSDRTVERLDWQHDRRPDLSR
jgi:hypothetical protein